MGKCLSKDREEQRGILLHIHFEKQPEDKGAGGGGGGGAELPCALVEEHVAEEVFREAWWERS
jgi:hypothetical protein